MPGSRAGVAILAAVGALLMSVPAARAQARGDEHGKPPAGPTTPKPTVVGPASSRTRPTPATAKSAPKPSESSGAKAGEKPPAARTAARPPARTPRPAATPRIGAEPLPQPEPEHAAGTGHAEPKPAPGRRPTAMAPATTRTTNVDAAVREASTRHTLPRETATRLNSVRSAINDAVRAVNPRVADERIPPRPAPASAPRMRRSPVRAPAIHPPEVVAVPRVPVRWPARWHEVRWPTPISRLSLAWPDLEADAAKETPPSAPSEEDDGFGR
jgi:hypothetical protein